jgi:YidC/Oxa1 family membrane protein insertase
MSVPLLDTLVSAIYSPVASLAELLGPVGGAAPTIVLCTAVLRLLLVPLALSAVRGERSRQALAPEITKLRRRYGKDPARLSKELAELHQTAGVSPLAGCLPMLLQTPFFMVWYRIFTSSTIDEHSNVLLSQRFLGSELSAHLLDGGHVLAFAPLMLALTGLGMLAIWRTHRVAAASGQEPLRGVFAVLPLASVFSALVMPLAAVVYLVTTMTWTAIENVVLRRGLPAVAPRAARPTQAVPPIE